MIFLGPGFATLLVFAALCHFNRISIAVAGSERIMEQYRLSPVAMGDVYTVFLVGYTLAMMPAGWFIDRYGPRAALTVSGFSSAVLVALTAVAALAGSSAAVLAVLYPIRALAGVATAPLHPAAAQAVALGVPAPARSLANGVVNGAAVAGIASTYVLFGDLIDAINWPAAFVVSGLATTVVTVAWVAAASRWLGDSPRARPETATAGVRAPLLSRDLMLLTLSYGGLGYFRYLFFYWINYYFHVVLAESDAASRVEATVPTLAMAVGMFGGGGLADRLQRRWGRRLGLTIVPSAGLAASGLLLLAGTRQTSAGWAVVAFSLALAAAGMCEGPFWTAVTALGGQRGGSAGAVLNIGGNVGGLLAPVVTPLVSARLGWPAGFGLAAVLCLGAATLWRWIDPYRERAPAAPGS
jgi:MFS family permease